MKQFIKITMYLLGMGGFLLHSAFGQCGDTTHTTEVTDVWTSCSTSANPNPSRDDSHWVQYDFGYVYTLTNTHIWNANVSGETDKGFKEVSIDYSLDGMQWVELGTFEFEEATGYNSYAGFGGPNFNGIQARYVLMTAKSNWGHAQCYGLSEVRFGLDNVTSLDLDQIESPLSVYPNPASSYINVDFGLIQPVMLRVVSLEGRIIQEYNGVGKVPSELFLSDLPDGLYFLSVQDVHGVYHSAGFVKE